MKCKYCKSGRELGRGKSFHIKCKVLYEAEHIPKSQKRKLSVCPICKKRFYFWQKARKHAQENKHYGDYSSFKESE